MLSVVGEMAVKGNFRKPYKQQTREILQKKFMVERIPGNYHYEAFITRLCNSRFQVLVDWLCCPTSSSYTSWPARGGRFVSEVDQIRTKLDKSRISSDQMSVHFGAECQNVLKSELKKSRVCTV